MRRLFQQGVLPPQSYLAEMERAIFGNASDGVVRYRDEFHCDCGLVTNSQDMYRQHRDLGHHIRNFDSNYPLGTDDLWYAHFRRDPEGGDMDGTAIKLEGTLIDAAIQAEEIGRRENLILQCLRRRY